MSNEQTEKLRDKLLEKYRLIEAETILRWCKESGLRFVEFPKDLEGACICRVEEIEL